ncbi:MAG: glucans biosynthesis protein MdoC [Henriciella sp.]
MLLLIVLVHVAHVYNPVANWIVSSPESSWLAPILSSIPVFSMPGFFMISSILSIFLLRKRSYSDWARGRLFRISVPLFFGILILSPITIYFASQAAAASASNSTAFVGDLDTDFSIFDRRWIGHLWFLSTLGLFTVVAWWGFAKGMLMPWLNETADKLVKLDQKVSTWWTVAIAISLWSFGVKAAFYLFKTFMGFEPTLVAVLNADTLFSYFPIFMLGLLLGASEELRTTLFRTTSLRVWVLAITFVAYVLGAGIDNSVWGIVRKLVSSGLGTGIALFLFGYLADKIGKPNPTVKTISKYSYTVYLVHYPICNLLGYYFIFVSMDPTLEFLLVVLLTYTLSFLAAWVIAESKLLTFAFNGEPFWSKKAHKTMPRTGGMPHRATDTETAPNR